MSQSEIDIKMKFVEHQINDEIREDCRQLCGEYLAGPWSDLKADQIDVQIVEGGMSNSIYCCVNSKLVGEDDSKFPRKVLVRKYGSIFVGKSNNMRSVSAEAVSAIVEILHQKGLGPQVYGIFNGGRIEQFIENRHFTPEEMRGEKIAPIIMKKVAGIHHLDMPISKNPEAILNLAYRLYEEGMRNEFLFFEKIDPNHRPALEYIMNFDVPGELDWIREMIPVVRSPVVFCHNDLSLGNFFERLDRESLEERVFIIDYDNCSYGYRGFDLAYFLRLKNSSERNTGENGNSSESEENRPLLQAYLERYTEIHGDQFDPEIDNLDHLELEADFFTVAVDCLFNGIMRITLNKHFPLILEGLRQQIASYADHRTKVRDRCQRLKQASNRFNG